MNLLTVAELKRRGMAAIEEGLQRGPVHIVKRNRPAAVVLSEDDYQRLAKAAGSARARKAPASALDWLLGYAPPMTRTRAEIDAGLAAERDAWGSRG